MRLTYKELRTRRLELRSPRLGDAPLIYESFAADPEVTRYLTWRAHRSIADAEAALRARLERLTQGIEYSWIIELSDSRHVVGVISAWLEGDAVEVGFVLARSFWNQGLMTEATLEIKQWALTSRGVSHIWATCDLENRATARVLEKAGFTNRGVFEREIIRPNVSPQPRPSLLYSASRSAAQPELAADGPTRRQE